VKRQASKSTEDDLKQRLKEAKEAVQSARDEQIKNKTEKESLQTQLDELIQQAQDEFGLNPEELEGHAKKLEKESVKLLEEVEQILGLGEQEESDEDMEL
jgi:hypothetical protein